MKSIFLHTRKFFLDVRLALMTMERIVACCSKLSVGLPGVQRPPNVFECEHSCEGRGRGEEERKERERELESRKGEEKARRQTSRHKFLGALAWCNRWFLFYSLFLCRTMRTLRPALNLLLFYSFIIFLVIQPERGISFSHALNSSKICVYAAF